MDRLQEILDLLANADAVTRLTDEEIGAFETELLGLFDQIRAGEVEGIERHDVARLRSIGEACGALRTETAARYAAAEEVESEVGEVEAFLRGEAEAETEASTETPEGDGGDPEPAAAAEPETPAEPATADTETPAETPVPEPVAAAGTPAGLPSTAELLARRPASARRTPAERVAVTEEPFAWVLDNGTVARSLDDIADFMENTNRRYGRSAKGVELKIPVASMRTLAADTPKLIPGTAAENTEKLEALVAAGGWGAPAPVDYTVDTISVADRPVRDFLRQVETPRGALLFVTPPLYSAITRGGPAVSNASTGVWTAATDATPGGTTKGFQTVPNPTTVTETVDALYAQSQVGNLLARGFPEWVRAWMSNLMSAQAQQAEEHLLAKMDSHCVAVTHNQLLGVTRDLPVALITLVAAERRRHRMRPDAGVAALFPTTVLDLIQMDILRSGVNFMDSAPQVVARNYLTTLLAAANIRAGFYYDDDAIPGAQTTGGVIDLHTHINVRVFHEDAFVQLDNGQLDLGIVRDATLVSTNDYRIFSETFEGLAFRGHWAYKLGMEVAANGTASAAIDIHTKFEGS